MLGKEIGPASRNCKFSFGGKGVSRGFSVPPGSCDKFYPYDKGVITKTEPRPFFYKETREQRARLYVKGVKDLRTVVSPGPIYPVLDPLDMKGHPVLRSAPKYTMGSRLEYGSMTATVKPSPSDETPAQEIVSLERLDNYRCLSSSKQPPAFSFSQASREPIKDKDPGPDIGCWEHRKDGTKKPIPHPSQFSYPNYDTKTFGPTKPHESRLQKKLEMQEAEERKKALKAIDDTKHQKNPARFGVIMWKNKGSQKPPYSQYRLYG